MPNTQTLTSSWRNSRHPILKRPEVALAPKKVVAAPIWAVDDRALGRYKCTLPFEHIKEIARTSVSATVFVCDGFRIRPKSDADEFASLNKLNPGSRSLSQFGTVALGFKE